MTFYFTKSRIKKVRYELELSVSGSYWVVRNVITDQIGAYFPIANKEAQQAAINYRNDLNDRYPL